MARIQGREVYERLHGKVDPELVSILVSIVERQQVQHQQIMSMAEGHNKILDMMADIIRATGNVAKVGESISQRLGFGKDVKSMVESFSEQDDDTGPTTPR